MKSDSEILTAASIGQGVQQHGLPPWALLHIPHDSIVIPAKICS